MPKQVTGSVERRPSRTAAMQTRHRGAELHRDPVQPDPLYQSDGKLFGRPAYDSGIAAPPVPDGAPGLLLQALGVEECVEAVLAALPADLVDTPWLRKN